jgi:hypothetical protein
MSQDLWTGRLADTLRNVKPVGPTPNGSPGLGSKSTLSTMELFWWSVTLVLMAIGLVGTVLPIFPGPAVIFAAAILHRSILGTEKSIGWPSILVLLFLALASYAIDFAGGWLGARRFGSHPLGHARRRGRGDPRALFRLAGAFVRPGFGCANRRNHWR